MSPASGHWEDLLPRLLSALALAGFALLVTWLGGLAFNCFTTLIASVMVWELARMLHAGAAALWLAVGAGVSLLLAAELPGNAALPLILVPAIAGLRFVESQKLGFLAFVMAILAASYGVMVLRAEAGFLWMIWFAFVVVATDVGGYFAGRLIGGPKIWPKLSPKKTWSGTAAGWIAAALVSVPFAIWSGGGWFLVATGAALALASQMGDLWESALKRRAGVKDASAIIPGHGGLLDRFDSMMGASLLLLVAGWVIDVPPLAGV